MTSTSKELVYGFPLDGPMNVLHVDGFTVGASINYAGNKGFLVAACGMCTFAVVDPVPESNSTTCAQALSMIILRSEGYMDRWIYGYMDRWIDG